MILSIIFATLLLIGLFRLLSRKKDKPKERGIIINPPSGIKEPPPGQKKYPHFIPFHEWKGFWNGLHYENKLYYLTKGKRGRCPKNFDPL